MRASTWRWGPALFCVVLMLATGAPPATAEDASTSLAVGDSGTHLTWRSAMSGDLVLRLTLGTQGAGQCAVRADASGAVGAAPVFTYLGHDVPGGGWTALGHGDTHVHAGDASIRSSAPGDLWAARHSHVITADVEETYVFAAKGLQPWSDPFAGSDSVVLDITCFGSFSVQAIGSGTELILSDPQGLRGGLGASTEPYGLAVNALDGAATDLSAPDGLLRWRSSDPVGAGIGRATHPDGSSTRAFSGADDWFVDGPGGGWTLRLDARASALDPDAVILLGGTRPVTHL